jgi:pilus assembly protein Flp/PilA
MERWKRFLSRQRASQLMLGQGLVEYALILIFVAVVLIGLLVILGPGISDIYQNIVDVLDGLS